MIFSEKEQLKQTKILYKIINIANKAENFTSLIEVIVKITIKLMNFDGGGIYLINEDTRTAELQYHIGLRQDFLKIITNVIIDDPRYSQVFISGKPIYAENLLKKNPNMAEVSGFGSIISIPILTNKKIIGAMNIGSKDRYIISQFEKELLEYLSYDIGTVISKIQAEQRLKESEKKYRTILHNISGIVYWENPDRSAEYIHGCESITGYSTEEMNSKNIQWLDIVHIDDKDTLLRNTFHLNDNPMQNIQEYRIITKEGNIRWVSDRKFSRFNEEGVFIGIDGIVYDITNRKKAERRLKESEKKYRTTLQNISGMVYWGNSDWSAEYIHGCESITGYSTEEMNSKNIQWLDIVHNDDKDIILSNSAHLYDNSTQNIQEYRIITKKGNIRWVSDRKFSRFNEEGVFIGIDGIVYDITNRKEAERRLKESEIKFRLIAENVLVGIVIIQDNQLKYINKTMSVIYEYSNEEMINWTSMEFLEVIHPDDKIRANEYLQKRLQGNINLPKQNSHRIITKTGEIKHIESNGQSIIYQEKLADLYLIADVSEWKKFESQLIESEEKTREAFNLANFYKDLFAHDMNNILQSIQLTADYFKLFKNNASQMDKLDDIATTIKTQAKRGAKLVSNIRKLSSLEENEIILKPIIVSEHLNNSKKNIHDDFQNLNIEIDVKGLKDEITILGNDLLVDIFDNILNNAVKFTYDKETILIEISIEKTILEGIPFVKIQFKDHGMGIKDERKDKIFQRSHIGEYDGQGMGMGLSLVRKIVERYDGIIKVEDRVKGEYQKGSNFILLFKEALR